MQFSVSIGRRFGCRQVEKHPNRKIEIIGIAESTVFTLLALLIAFTFSGAYERFENRKLHIIDEANAFAKAYEYIDLLPAKYQPDMRVDIRKYLDLHLATYLDIPNMKKVFDDINQASIVQHKIWKDVTAAGNTDPNSNIIPLAITSMTNMFDAFHTGIEIAQVHPPRIIFILLIGLSVLGGFLVGYSSAENKHKFPIHTLCYVILTSFIIYVIINLEYPRVGFIHLDAFDHILMTTRQEMN